MEKVISKILAKGTIIILLLGIFSISAAAFSMSSFFNSLFSGDKITGAVTATVASCGDTITADTTLDGDIGPCTGNGLIIGASDITLDCAGFKITPKDLSSSIGVFIPSSAVNRVTIKNCNFDIGRFTAGMRVSESDNVNVLNSYFKGTSINAGGLTFIHGANFGKSLGNTFEDLETGIAAVDSFGVNITGNAFVNTRDALLIDGVFGATVIYEDNTFLNVINDIKGQTYLEKQLSGFFKEHQIRPKAFCSTKACVETETANGKEVVLTADISESVLFHGGILNCDGHAIAPASGVLDYVIYMALEGRNKNTVVEGGSTTAAPEAEIKNCIIDLVNIGAGIGIDGTAFNTKIVNNTVKIYKPGHFGIRPLNPVDAGISLTTLIEGNTILGTPHTDRSTGIQAALGGRYIIRNNVINLINLGTSVGVANAGISVRPDSPNNEITGNTIIVAPVDFGMHISSSGNVVKDNLIVAGTPIFQTIGTVNDVSGTILSTDADADFILDAGFTSACSAGNKIGCNDNCLGLANSDQADSDNDAVGNVCDVCRFTVDQNQLDSDSSCSAFTKPYASDPKCGDACEGVGEAPLKTCSPVCTGGNICDGLLGTCQLCQSLPAGLISWWPGDGNANEVKFGYISSKLGGIGFAPGQVGQAFSFDGVDDGILILQKDVHLVDTFTMDAWINPNSVVGSQAILVKWEDSFGLNERSYFFGLENNKLRVVISNDGQFPSADLRSTSLIPTNQWTHVAATFDGADVKLYINGVLDSSLSSASSTLFDADAPLTIGKHPSLNIWLFSGLIDEVEMFSRALSASEIQSIYNAGTAGKCKLVTAVCGNGVIEGEEECDGTSIYATDTCAGFGFSGGSIACTNCVLDTSSCLGCLSPTYGLISWWPGDGDAIDIQDANNGILQGGVTFTDEVTNFGKVGKAFVFDGADDYVSIAPNSNQNVNAFTIDAWIYPEDVGLTGLKGIVSKFDDSVGVNKRAYVMGLQSGKLRMFFSKDGFASLGDATKTGDLLSRTDIPLNIWTHVAATFDGISHKIYINGILDTQQKIEFKDIFDANDVPLILGRFSSGGFFKGMIDEVELFGRALTADEIKTIFQAGSSGKCKGVGVALPLCSKTQAVDLNNVGGVTVGDTIISANVVAGLPLCSDTITTDCILVSSTGKDCVMPQSITVS